MLKTGRCTALTLNVRAVRPIRTFAAAVDSASQSHSPTCFGSRIIKQRTARGRIAHVRLFSSSSPACRADKAAARAILTDLPDKVDVCIGPAGRLSKVIEPRRSNKITTRVGSSYAGNHTFSWIDTPTNVLLVKKAQDAKATRAMSHIIKHLRKAYPHVNILLEREVIDADEDGLATQYAELVAVDPSQKAGLVAKTDFVITLGGDGSILHVSNLFDHDAVPPVLSFSMGTLGFLLPYDIISYKEAIKDVMDGNISLLLRMRLRQTTHRQDGETLCQDTDLTDKGGCYDVHLMNEVTLHRGREPHMTKIDAYVDGQHLTQAIVSNAIPASTPCSCTDRELPCSRMA